MAGWHPSVYLKATSTTSTSITVKIYGLDSTYTASDRKIAYYLDGELIEYDIALEGGITNGGEYTFDNLSPETPYYIYADIYQGSSYLNPNWIYQIGGLLDTGNVSASPIEVTTKAITWSLTTGSLSSSMSSSTSKTINIAQYKIYRYSVKFTNSGEATFYTTGNLDTIGYLTTSSSWSSSRGEPTDTSKYDDDSGSGNNFKLVCSVTAGTTYYIWIRAYDGLETGSIKLYVDPPSKSVWDYKLDNDTFCNPNISQTRSQEINVASGTLYRYKVIFAYSGEAIFYTIGNDINTYGFLSDVATGIDSSVGEPTSYIESDDGSYRDGNFKITYNVTAGKIYFIWVSGELFETSGITTLVIEPPTPLILWSWTSSNGTASTTQTQNAYKAITKVEGYTVNDFSYLVWNDLCDKTKEALAEIGGYWQTETGKTFDQDKMSSTDTTLTAVRFNDLMYNIKRPLEGSFSYTIYPSRLTRDVVKGETVYGEHFTQIAELLNTLINKINGS